MDNKDSKYILVVDDKKENIDLLCAIFRKYGYKYLTAQSGEESLEIISSHDDIGLVLMDVKMRGIDGVEAMKSIKTKNDLPVLAVTGIALDSDRNELVQQGFDDYISKPIDIKLLISKVENYLPA